MAESPSSPSSKALLALISSTSPSPITSINQPSSYDNYQPYVLVKGSMDGPWCRNEGKGIVLDEASCKASSPTIPFKLLHSKGNVLGTKSMSLPPSPTKPTSITTRSIDDLRAAIQQMKESSKLEDEEDTNFGHLPMELRMNDDYPTPSLQEKLPSETAENQLTSSNFDVITSPECSSHAIRQGESSNPKLNSNVSAINQPFPKALSHPLLSYHGKANGPPEYSDNPMHPVHSMLSSGKHSFTPNSQKTFRSKPNQQIPGSPKDIPSGINQSSPPPIQNQIMAPDKGNFQVDFPPLAGTTKPTNFPVGPSNQTETTNPLVNQPNMPTPPWSQLFSSNRSKSNGTPLNYIPPIHGSNTASPTVSITAEEVSGELLRWKHAIVGHVIGANTPYKLMKQFVERRWRNFGEIELFILKPGIFIFNFKDEDSKQQVLEQGPWSYFDKPLMLKPWTPSQSYDKSTPDKLPIWIRLPHLKLHLWSATTLSKIASHIGTPLFTDKMTATRQRLAYARIYVEVDVNASLPKEVEIKDHNGISFFQQVDYEWIPIKCECCKQIGHHSSKCPRVARQVWRPVHKKEEPAQLQQDKKDKLKGIQSDHAENFPSNNVMEEPLEEQHQYSSRMPPKEEALTLATQNQFACIGDYKEEAVSAMEPTEAKPPDNSSPIPLQMEGPENTPLALVMLADPKACPIPPLTYSSGEEAATLQLSNTKKKKKGKMQHALAQRTKAMDRKAGRSSPSS